ncbi:MAG: hypothetical protein IH946_08515, partial [Bacteroidetes bacterium]|nr:hypothetical protein [Bacteroidota bacterium]
IFFPEKRTFFLENADLFERWGFSKIKPFFSRRIGLFDGKTVPIIGGVRLSGKLNPKLRVGLLNVHTEGVRDLSLKSQNYTVAVFQQQTWGRSHIGGIMVNRQAFVDSEIESNDFNRIIGFDYNLFSKSNNWRGKVFYHKSFTQDKLKTSDAHASWLMHNGRKIFAMWNHEYVGKNYIADVGFVPRLFHYDPINDEVVRLTFWRLEPILEVIFYPKKGPINFHKPGVYYSSFFNDNLVVTDHELNLSYAVVFNNTSDVKLNNVYHYTWLRFPTNITGKMDSLLPVGTYEYFNSSLVYNSNTANRFSFQAFLDYGSFFNGTNLSFGATLRYRVQPWGNFSMDFVRNQIRFPSPYDGTNLTLIGPKLEFSFTRSLFFTTFIQYNTQADNLNINSRLQWRFKPMSDLFIVYTDNYLPEFTGLDYMKFGAKNRAIVLKFTYWFTL